MNRFSLLLIFLTIHLVNVNSQNISAEIPPQYPVLYSNIYVSPQFYHLGNQIRFKEVRTIISINSEAHEMIRSGRTQKAFGYIMAGTGGFILGYNRFNPDPHLKKRNLIFGGAIAGGALLVDYLGSKKIKSGLDLYNTNVMSQFHSDLSFSIGLSESSNGIGLQLSF
jgi:hypothetical protein